MNRTLWIAAIAALACGCGNSTNPPPTAGVGAAGSASKTPGSAAADQEGDTKAADRSVPTASARPADQLVRVTGCLMGGEALAAAPGNSAAPGTTPAVGGTANGSGPNLFVLTRAKPDADGAGVGANGAGGSGGPLISGIAEYRLDGDPTELRSHLNQQVRISARLDPRQTMTGSAPPVTAGSNDRASITDAGTAGGSARPSGADTSQRGTSATNVPAMARLLIVESVRMVASSCSAP